MIMRNALSGFATVLMLAITTFAFSPAAEAAIYGGGGSGGSSGACEVFIISDSTTLEVGDVDQLFDESQDAEEYAEYMDEYNAEYLQYMDEYNVELTPEQQETLDNLIKKIPTLKKLTEITPEYSRSSDNWSVWLTEPYEEDEDIFFVGNASLTFDTPTGDLLYYSVCLPEWASSESPPVDFARAQAESFIKRVAGEQTEYKPGYQSGGSSNGASNDEGVTMEWSSIAINFHPIINGIPFSSNSTRVDVNAAGIVTGYERYDFDNWSGEKLDHNLLPEPEQVTISLSDAEKTRAEFVTMLLNYRLQNEDYLEAVFPLNRHDMPMMYLPSDEPQCIDAISGKCMELNSYIEPEYEELLLVGQGKKLIASDRLEAEELLTEKFGMDFKGINWEYDELEYNEEDYEAMNPYYTGKNKCYYTWQNSEYVPPDEYRSRFICLTTLSETGEVLNFYTGDSNDYSDHSSEPVISKETARSMAVGLLEQYLPVGETELQLQAYSSNSFNIIPNWVDDSMLEEVDYQQFSDQDNEVHFSFDLLYQGVPVMGAQCSMSVNLATGELTSYYMNIPDSIPDLPDPGLAVTPQSAKDEYLQQNPMELIYIWPEWLGIKAPAPILAYSASVEYDHYWHFVDGLTGQVISYNYMEW